MPMNVGLRSICVRIVRHIKLGQQILGAEDWSNCFSICSKRGFISRNDRGNTVPCTSSFSLNHFAGK